MLTLVTYTFNDHAFARAQLERISQFGNLIQTAIVVDDGSDEPFTMQHVQGCSGGVHVIRHAANMGPAAAKRTGIGHAATEFIFSIDSDIVCDRIWLPSALEILLEHAEVGLVGAQPLAADLGDTLSRALHIRSLSQPAPQRAGFASGEIWLLRKSAYDAAGGLEGYTQRTHEDWHLCRKIIHAGYDILLHRTGTVRQTRKIRRAAQVRRDAVYYFQSYKSILESRGPKAILDVFTGELLQAVLLADEFDADILIYIELVKILLVLAEIHQGNGHEIVFTEVFRSFATIFKDYPVIMSTVAQDISARPFPFTGASVSAPYAAFFGYLADIVGAPRLERIDRQTLPRSLEDESESRFDFHYLL